MTSVLTRRDLGGLKVVPVQKRSPFLNLLIYGESGIGKTTLAGSADLVEALRPVIVVDVEGGTESLVRSYPNVDTVRVTTWASMQDVYNDLHRGGHGYKTVILDSLTEIQKFNMYAIMEKRASDNSNIDIDVPDMRAWGQNLEQIRKFVRAFRDLSLNTVFTALVTVDQDQRTGVRTMRPQLSGKMSGEVSAFMDIVTYYYSKEVEGEAQRLLLTAKTPTQIAKDRTGLLPPVIISPTMKAIYDIIASGTPAVQEPLLSIPGAKPGPPATPAPQEVTTPTSADSELSELTAEGEIIA